MNTRTPHILMTLGMSTTDNWVKLAVARNPHTPPETLRLLGRDDNRNIRYFVAGNPSTRLDVLEELLYDPDERVGLITVNEFLSQVFPGCFRCGRTDGVRDRVIMGRLYRLCGDCWNSEPVRRYLGLLKETGGKKYERDKGKYDLLW